MPCKAKGQYLLTCKVSRYWLLALNRGSVSFVGGDGPGSRWPLTQTLCAEAVCREWERELCHPQTIWYTKSLSNEIRSSFWTYLTTMPDRNAWQERLTGTPDSNAWQQPLTATPDSNAWQQCLTAMPDITPVTVDQNDIAPMTHWHPTCTRFTRNSRLHIPAGHEKVYTPLYKVACGPFHVQGDGIFTVLVLFLKQC